MKSCKFGRHPVRAVAGYKLVSYFVRVANEKMQQKEEEEEKKKKKEKRCDTSHEKNHLGNMFLEERCGCWHWHGVYSVIGMTDDDDGWCVCTPQKKVLSACF